MEKIIAIIMLRPQDAAMSLWMKRVMWIILFLGLPAALDTQDGTIIGAMIVSEIVWILEARVSEKRICFYFDVVCMTIVSACSATILLSAKMGIHGALMCLVTAVVAIFILGVFWGGLFGILFSLFVTVIMSMESLEWVREGYSEIMCRRFPYMFICFVGVTIFLEYGIQQYWTKKVDYRNELGQLIENGRKERSEVSIKVLLTMYNAMAAKIPIMKKHSDAVGEWTRELARRMGYRKDELQTMYYAGLLHDIGKIGLPDYIWDKDELSDDEYRIYMQHVDIGYEILKNLDKPEIADAARYHHEKMDGSGYKVAKGTSIPPVARIVAVANLVVRLEERGCSDEEIIDEITPLAEEKYDEEVVANALLLLKERIKREEEAEIFGF